MATGRWRALALVLLLASWVRPASAQSSPSTSIVTVQSLSFGVLLPGVRETVQITDVARRAMVALTGSGAVDVTLVLPATLDSPNAGSIPLVFGAADAGMLPTVASPVIALNPYQVNRIQLTADRAVHFVLGGTALPSHAHAAGHYTARVLVIVSQPGT